jgi:hypothetical protein
MERYVVINQNLTPEEWNLLAARTIKSVLSKRGMKYHDLARHLKLIGVDETQASIASKMSRGTFSFTFVMQIMQVLEIDYLDLTR